MIHPRQTQQQELINELDQAGAIFKGTAIVCPFHEDHNPSGGIFEGKDGIWRFKCHSCGAGGDVFDIEARRTGRPLSEILHKAQGKQPTPPPAAKTARPDTQAAPMKFDSLQAIYSVLAAKYAGQLESLHEYSDSFSMIRWRGADGKKEMRPVICTPAGYFLKFPENRILYHLDILAGAETIIITEGEGKADILAGYGFTATTSPGGSQAAAKTDWKPLAGRNCILWPDADVAGTKYQKDVQRILEGLTPPARIQIIDPSDLDLTDGEDSADYIRQLKAAGFDELRIKQNLLDVFRKAKSTGPGQELLQEFSEIAAGRREPVELGFSTLDAAMQFLPGTLNCIAGSAGSSKSLLVLQLARLWHEKGIKTAVFELEKDHLYHSRRALAQESENALLTNNRWVQANIDIARAAATEHCDFMDSFGRLIFTEPQKIIYQKDICEWVQHRADAGCRIVCIDPATKAQRRAEPWVADFEFVNDLQRIATMTRIVIFMVLHPQKGQITQPELGLIAGGAAYERFSDNCFWLESHDPKRSVVRFSTGTTEVEHNRTIWILKSRDGSGDGHRIAFQFDKETLTLRDIGKIEKTKTKKTDNFF